MARCGAALRVPHQAAAEEGYVTGGLEAVSMVASELCGRDYSVPHRDLQSLGGALRQPENGVHAVDRIVGGDARGRRGGRASVPRGQSMSPGGSGWYLRQDRLGTMILEIRTSLRTSGSNKPPTPPELSASVLP